MSDTPTQRPGRATEVALLDLDNSLRDGWIVVDWAQQLAEVGLLSQSVAAEVVRMIGDYQAGTLVYGALAVSIPEAFAHGLRGAEVKTIVSHARAFVENDSEVRPFVRDLLAGLRQRGIAAILVSGAPQEILEPAARRLGATESYGTVLDVRDGRYLGTVTVNRATAQEKQRVVETVQGGQVRVELALGDSSADLPLLRAARVAVLVGGQGVADPLPGHVRLDADAYDASPVWRQLDR